MGEPQIHQNPNPRQRHEITVHIEDAPGPFESVKANIGFQISNAAKCASRDPISGATPTPSYYPGVLLTRMSDGFYRGEFYLDLPQDESYYGKGVCKWQFVAVDVVLENNGVSFYYGINSDVVATGVKATGYEPKRLYYGSSVDHMKSVAEPLSDEISKHRNDYFSISLMTRKVSHE